MKGQHMQLKKEHIQRYIEQESRARNFLKEIVEMVGQWNDRCKDKSLEKGYYYWRNLVELMGEQKDIVLDASAITQVGALLLATQSMLEKCEEQLVLFESGRIRVVNNYGSIKKEWVDEKGRLHREDGPAIEWYNGSKEWRRNGLLHREDGPACEWADGRKEWHRNGKKHREDGPAIERPNGDKIWYRNDKKHREDGPAVELTNGDKAWYLDGKFHREDGPAIERPNGDKIWYLDGIRIKKENRE